MPSSLSTALLDLLGLPMRSSITLLYVYVLAGSFNIAAAASIDLSTNAEFPNNASQSVATVQPKEWEESAWLKCFANFKRSVKPAMYPKEQRLLNGICISSNKSPHAPDGACFMEAVSPSDLLSATDFEVKLVCMKGSTEVMVCTNKKGHYMEAMTSGMSSDRRCDGFPNLLAVDMRKNGPNKALEHSFRNRKPNTVECERQVKVIQRLENDTRFDSDRSIREGWSQAVALGTRMGCHF